MKKVELNCEYCGVIGKFEGDEDVLHYALTALTDEHWQDVHPPDVPSIRYDWSDV